MNRTFRIFVAVVTWSLVVGWQSVEATVIAQDTASDAVYDDGWQTGDNGGFGFGAWTIRTTTGGNDAFNGVFVGSSTGNGDGDSNGDGDINTSPGNRALGLYANSGNAAVAFRAFNTPLSLGTRFIFRWTTVTSTPAALRWDLPSAAGTRIPVRRIIMWEHDLSSCSLVVTLGTR